ncbi:MAG TPA: class I SAM-dependent methyltransferase [Vicinamibacteria bacterium]|nr:class I SAM-dependent methyltransferase [Vicinamibacteria bacterium]
MFDLGTIRHLKDRGIAQGWRCLELGGGGSIATWLSARVGPTGGVLVANGDPGRFEALRLPNLEVRRHDLARDPLPEATFDLVHARLVLLRVPEREAVLARLVAALKPGGWLVDEEFETSLAPDPSLAPGEALPKTYLAMARVMDGQGVDRSFGRRLFGLLRAHGLETVGAEGQASMWSCHSPGAPVLRAIFEHLRGEIVSGGHVTKEEFDRDVAHFSDHGFFMPSPLLWTAWGRRA